MFFNVDPKTGATATQKAAAAGMMGKTKKAPDAKYSDFKAPGLTAGQKSGLQTYGAPYGYKVVNPYLHKSGKVFDSNKMQYVDPTPNQVTLAKTTIATLDSAFEKAVPTKEPLTVYRRAGTSFFGPDPESKIGQTLTNKSYTSTTTATNAKPGNGYGYESKKVLWEINLPAGTKALQGNDFEKEVILPRDGDFTVTGVEKMDDGTTKVQVTFGHSSIAGSSASSSSSTTSNAPKNLTVAEKWAGKKVTKNSVEYWERAYDKTIEARDKAKPGGKIWTKMDDRAKDVQAMIDHMKATNKPTLEQSDWDANKAVYKTQTKAATSVADEYEHDIELDGPLPAKKPVVSAKKKSAANDEVFLGSTENADNDDIDAAANKIGVKPKDIWHAKDDADDFNQTMYISKSPVLGGSKTGPTKPEAGTPYIKISPYGDLHYSENAGDTAPPNTAPPNNETSLGSLTGSDDIAAEKLGVHLSDLWDANDNADFDNKAMYVTKTPSGFGKISPSKPDPGKPYVKVTPDSKLFYSENAIGPSPEDTSTFGTPGEAIAGAQSLADSTGKTHYAWKDWGATNYSVSDKKPTDPNLLVEEKHPSGGLSTGSSSTTHDMTNPGGAAAKAKELADKTGKPYYIFKPWGSTFYTASPNPPSDSSLSHKKINPGGDAVSSTDSSTSSTAADVVTPGSKAYETNKAKEWAAKHKQDLYVVYDKDYGKWTVTFSPPPPGFDHVVVGSDGAIKQGKTATAAGRGHVAAPDTAFGPATEFEFDDEDNRRFGLDVMNADSRDRKAFEGTPEGAAIAGRLLPTDDEMARHYTASGAKLPHGTKSAISAYQGTGSRAINNGLRGKIPPSSTTLNQIDKIDKAMAAYATKEPMLLSRGLSYTSDFPQENLAGKMIQDAGYMSTAVGGSGGYANGMLMKIYAPAGTHGIPMNGAMGAQSKYPHEREFLLPRGTTMLISKDEVIDGIRVVTGTIVPVPKAEKTGTGIIDRPSSLTDAAYSKEGLEYLRTQGRAKWAKRYAKDQTLALSRRMWYNRLVRERQRRTEKVVRT